MTTLVPTSSQNQQQQPGTTVTPSTGVESYEDMFKEITRKLYGEESAHGLYPINNAQVAQLAQTPSAPPEGERSFTTLVSDRNLAQLEYDGVIQTDGSSNFKSEDHLSTAFGLAALMHNGFPPPAVFPVTTNNAKQTNGDDRQWSQQQSQPQQDEQIWNSNKTTYTQKLFKIKTKQEPQTSEIIINTSSGAVANVKTENLQIQKRYSCTVCPYSTDRRDLFTRHENIHKEEKPFHCYACLKQFNRADHVKKHFLRMHREMDYDINKTRRYPPSSKQIVNANSASNNNNNNNNNSSANNNTSTKNNNATFFYSQQPVQTSEPQPAIVVPPPTINIPTFSQHQTSNLTSSTSNSHNTSSQQQQHQQHQQQQQQQQQQHHAHSIEQAIHQNNSNNQHNGVNNQQSTAINIKHEKSIQGKSPKIKGEKRFMCCYCPWSGADNWGLKRHLNTHTKPFVCLLCDYKAARSERLTTHILKVHNKKACNKCSFFADDQAQLTQHQIDSHQNEARVNPRVNNPTNNNPTQTIVTNQNLNQPPSSSVINPATAATNITNISASTGNVLRTLTNTLVPNIHTTASNHVFGTLNSSLSNGVSTIYTTSNVNTNIVEQINHHLASTNNWRTINTNPTSVSLSNINATSNTNNNNNNNNPVIRSQQTTNTLLTFTHPTMGNHTTTTSSKRKSGAERLFAYFEADDSDDLELDYARQLQMQALSRNTASVAQDFPNAGGDNTPTTKQQLNKGAITVKSCKDIKGIMTRDISDLYGAIGNLQQQKKLQQQQQQMKTKAMSPIDHSPPASDNNNYSIKRRRKSSSSNDDKENVNELLTKQLTFLKQQHQMFLTNLNESATMSDGERLKAISEINEIFEGMYRSSLTIISTIENDKFHKLQQPKIKQEPAWDSFKDGFEYEEGGNEENEAQNYSLPAFLRNNKEITVIMDPKMRIKAEPLFFGDDATNSSSENRKNRKQLKPKKIEKEIDGDGVVSSQQRTNAGSVNIPSSKHASSSSITASNINNLRDKHMLKLVTKKRCCYICRNKSIDANSYYSKESLLLHNLWRHSPKILECHQCQTKFNRIYKLKLHKTLKRH